MGPMADGSELSPLQDSVGMNECLSRKMEESKILRRAYYLMFQRRENEYQGDVSIAVRRKFYAKR